MTLRLSSAALRKLTDAPAGALTHFRTFALFVGWGHSGHSLIGALLDAHPHAAITNELNVLRQLDEHELDREALLSLTWNVASQGPGTEAWENTGYRYRVEGGHQGVADSPTVLGDKKGGGAARMVSGNPKTWDRLKDLLGSELRVIVIVRHPLDSIAAAAYRRRVPISIEVAAQWIRNAQSVRKVQTDLQENQIALLHHEDFVARPGENLRNLLAFLGLDEPEGYVEKCAALVKPSPNERRHSEEWPTQVVAYLREEIASHDLRPLLAGYELGPSKTSTS